MQVLLGALEVYNAMHGIFLCMLILLKYPHILGKPVFFLKLILKCPKIMSLYEVIPFSIKLDNN